MPRGAAGGSACPLPRVRVIGGGPAGAAAAISAAQEGAAVELFEKSAFPRHKVCGEFLSPEVAPVLDRLGVWHDFQAHSPARLARIRLWLGSQRKGWTFPEPAFGLSRFALDHLLLQKCIAAGAAVRREPAQPASSPTVIARGRKAIAPAGSRLFGFKAHFDGPIDDGVDLFFFSGCYAGVSAIEGGQTNICGLAPESLLKERNFEPEAVFSLCPPLADRLKTLNRAMPWLKTGPLVFRQLAEEDGTYPAGDALGFVDPFTGSGILAALATGRLAGLAAVGQKTSKQHLQDCRRLLKRQYDVAAVFQWAIRNGLAEALAPVLPGNLLFRLTRPAT